MFRKSVVLLFSGKAGTGKTTSAFYVKDKLAEANYNFYMGHFATSVKATAISSFDWDGIKDARGRRLLQEVGAVGRRYNPDIWVKRLFDWIAYSDHYPYTFIVIDDWRFRNEYNYISWDIMYNVYTVRMDAPDREILKGTPAYDDVSETELDGFGFDYHVDNRGTFDQLYEQLDIILEDVIRKEDTYKGEKI